MLLELDTVPLAKKARKSVAAATTCTYTSNSSHTVEDHKIPYYKNMSQFTNEMDPDMLQIINEGKRAAASMERARVIVNAGPVALTRETE